MWTKYLKLWIQIYNDYRKKTEEKINKGQEIKQMLNDRDADLFENYGYKIMWTEIEDTSKFEN